MKLNFLFFKKKKKILILFWLNSLSDYSFQANASFLSCIEENNICSPSSVPTDLYLGVRKISDIVNNKKNEFSRDEQGFCCNKTQTSYGYGHSYPCFLETAGCANNGLTLWGQCMIGSSFCFITNPFSTSKKSDYPPGICGGITGGGLTSGISNNRSYSCPNVKVLATLLNDHVFPHNFTWLCCGDNSCVVPKNVIVNTGSRIAKTSCPSNQYSLMCFNDDRKWLCTGDIIKDGFQTIEIGSCLLQIPQPSLVKINPSGLPTPWPIALVSCIISLVSVYTAQTERYELSWLAKFSISWSIFRSTTSLVGALCTWKENKSLDAFQYPELALLFSFPLAAIIFSLRNALVQLKDSLPTEETLQLEPIIILANDENEASEEELSIKSEEPSEEEIITQEKFRKLNRIYFLLKYLCSILLILSISAHYGAILAYHRINGCNNRNNLLNNARTFSQFITNHCDRASDFCITEGKIPNADSVCENWGEICYLTNKHIVLGDYYIRTITINIAAFLVPFLIFERVRIAAIVSPIFLFLIAFSPLIINHDLKIAISIGGAFLSFFLLVWKKFTKKFIKYLSHIVSGIIALISLSYLVVMISVQTRSWDLKGLCDIDPSLLTSKTGFLREWMTQEMTALKQVAFL